MEKIEFTEDTWPDGVEGAEFQSPSETPSGDVPFLSFTLTFKKLVLDRFWSEYDDGSGKHVDGSATVLGQLTMEPYSTGQILSWDLGTLKVKFQGLALELWNVEEVGIIDDMEQFAIDRMTATGLLAKPSTLWGGSGSGPAMYEAPEFKLIVKEMFGRLTARYSSIPQPYNLSWWMEEKLDEPTGNPVMNPDAGMRQKVSGPFWEEMDFDHDEIPSMRYAGNPGGRKSKRKPAKKRVSAKKKSKRKTVKRNPKSNVSCPHCKARAGRPCVNPSGGTYGKLHSARIKKAKKR